MKIIGHRGAAGLALENTRESLLIAHELGVDAIEFDVHKTSDDRLVLSHDPHFKRTADLSMNIVEHTYDELKTALAEKNIELLLAAEALHLLLPSPVIIDIKAKGCASLLGDLLQSYPKADITLSSLHHNELLILKKSFPTMKMYARERWRPISTLQFVKKNNLQGITFNVWFFSPLTYFLARRANLDVFLYTVNYRWHGKLIETLYPQAYFCSNYPSLFIKPLKQP